MLDRICSAVRNAIERLLVVWLVGLGLAAYYWDDLLPRRADPFLVTAPYARYFFAVTMLAIGSLLPRDEVREVFRRWRTVVGGTAIQYTSMPLLAYGFGRLFGLEGPEMVGVILVGCVPGAMASNVLTLAARGNVSYSISLTTSATIFSPLFVPAALWLALWGMGDCALGDITEKVARASAVLLCIVVLPVVSGYWLSRWSRLWAAAARRTAAIVANLTILWIIAIVVAANRDTLVETTPWLLAVLLIVNLGGYGAGLAGGRLLKLDGPMRRALTLEIGMQNAGLGTILAGVISSDPAAAIAPAIYTYGCMFTGTVLARLWAEWDRRRKAPLDRGGGSPL